MERKQQNIMNKQIPNNIVSFELSLHVLNPHPNDLYDAYEY